MGLFDSIGAFFSGKVKPDPEYAKYLIEQQNGCFLRVYPHSVPNDKPRSKMDLFWEIIECSYESSTTDVAGSFEFTVRGTDAWDELIYPDDIVRIFFGDKVATNDDVFGTSYNVATGVINQNASNEINTGGFALQIPVPGSGFDGSGGHTLYGTTEDVATLNMYEKFIGKVDRVTKGKSTPSESGGSVVTYTISGRSIGSALQDISLYYNEFLIGLNAVNIFLGTKAELVGTPDQLVLQALVLVLTSVPFPQWILPDEFMADMDFTDPETQVSLFDTNTQLVGDTVSSFQTTVASAKASSTYQANYGDIDSHLQALINASGEAVDNCLLMILSLSGINETMGTSFDRSFLNSVTTGFWDLLKHLSNDQFNELWFDLCPNGNPSGGGATTGIPVPSICMRQRPYDITKAMLVNASSRYDMFSGNENDTNSLIDYFAPGEFVPDGVGSSLFDLLDSGNGFNVFGSCDSTELGDNLPGNLQKYADENVTPSIMEYEMGFSGHDRLNGFLCLGQFSTGSAAEAQKRPLVQNGAFRLDPDSVQKFGIRMMETSTPYGQPAEDISESEGIDYNDYLTSFSHTLSNWNFMNQAFLNGRMTTRYNRDARIGMVCKYWETTISPDNPFPKLEISYAQGVGGRFRIGEPMTTTLTCIRGIRYDLSKSEDSLEGDLAGPDVNAATQSLPDGFDVAKIGLV